MNTNSSRYVLQGGDQGADRLKLLNSAFWPTSKIILEKAGLQEGMRFCDFGCGAGNMIVRVANLIHKKGHFSGIDIDKRSLEIAKKVTQEEDIPSDFYALDIEGSNTQQPSTYDFVYSRSVLTHLVHPMKALELMFQSALPGGTILVEDIEFTGSFSYPECPSYYRFTELYQDIVKKRGADPNIGPKLFGMFQKMGIKDIQISVCQPTFYEGDGKFIAQITLEHLREPIVSSNLASHDEIDRLIHEIDKFARDNRTLMSFPRVFQVWGKK